MNLSKNWLFGFLFLLLFLAVYFLLFKRKRIAITGTANKKAVNSFEEILFSRQDLTSEQKRFLRAVAMHETGKYTSSLFKNANNAFGMRPNQKRTKWYNAVTSGNYASYETYDDSISDVVEWMKIYAGGVPKTVDGVDLMKQKGYFEDTLSNYKNAVTYFFNNW
jgi:hypothetical protein